MRESTRKWVERAIKDLKIAENLCNQRYYEYACYFSQQSVEKLLKAFLIDNNRPYPRTHDIRELIKLCNFKSSIVIPLNKNKIAEYIIAPSKTTETPSIKFDKLKLRDDIEHDQT